MLTLFERIVPIEARLLHEGVFDPHILKAVFFAGSPGAGKSRVNTRMFAGIKGVSTSRFGLKLLDIDANYKALARKGGGRVFRKDPKAAAFWAEHGKDPGAVVRTAPHGPALHNRAWEVFEAQRKQFKRGKLGLIIDGTGRSTQNIKKMRDPLVVDGYDTFMVMVVSSLKTTLERNRLRARSLDADWVEKQWHAVEANRKTYRSWFGKRYIEIDNNNLSDAESNKDVQQQYEKAARRLLEMPLKNPRGIAWIKQQLQGAPENLAKKVWQGVGLHMPSSAVDALASVGKGRKPPRRRKTPRPAQHAIRGRKTTARVGWGGLAR